MPVHRMTPTFKKPTRIFFNDSHQNNIRIANAGSEEAVKQQVTYYAFKKLIIDTYFSLHVKKSSPESVLG